MKDWNYNITIYKYLRNNLFALNLFLVISLLDYNWNKMIKNKAVLDENKLDGYVVDAKDASFYTGNFFLIINEHILLPLLRSGIFPVE